MLDEGTLSDAGEREIWEAAQDVPELVKAVTAFEKAWRRWAHDMAQHPQLAANTEMFAIYQQAHVALGEA